MDIIIIISQIQHVTTNFNFLFFKFVFKTKFVFKIFNFLFFGRDYTCFTNKYSLYPLLYKSYDRDTNACHQPSVGALQICTVHISITLRNCDWELTAAFLTYFCIGSKQNSMGLSINQSLLSSWFCGSACSRVWLSVLECLEGYCLNGCRQ